MVCISRRKERGVGVVRFKDRAAKPRGDEKAKIRPAGKEPRGREKDFWQRENCLQRENAHLHHEGVNLLNERQDEMALEEKRPTQNFALCLSKARENQSSGKGEGV